MIGFLVRTAFKLFVVAGLVYFAVFVKLGKHTLYEHCARIATTREARELGADVVTAVGSAKDQLRQRVGNPIRHEEHGR